MNRAHISFGIDSKGDKKTGQISDDDKERL